MNYSKQQIERAESLLDYLEQSPRFKKLVLSFFDSDDEIDVGDGFSYRSKNPILLKTYLSKCKDANRKSIPSDDAVFKYFDDAKVPVLFRKLAWYHFRDSMIAKNKKQKDWRGTFRTYIMQGYLKLWFVNDNGEYQLTSLGKEKQACYKDFL